MAHKSKVKGKCGVGFGLEMDASDKGQKAEGLTDQRNLLLRTCHGKKAIGSVVHFNYGVMFPDSYYKVSSRYDSNP